MRVLHTSDWHLGRQLEGRSRLPEQRDFIDELYAILEKENIDIVLIAGDIFDTYNPPAEAEQLFYEALERICSNGRRGVVVIAGNHDSPDRVMAAGPLAKKYGIFLIGYPGQLLSNSQQSGSADPEVAATTDYSPQGNGVTMVNGGQGWLELSVPGCPHHVVVSVLPYPSEQRLNEIISQSLEDQDMQKGYSERVAQVFAQSSLQFREDTVNLAVSHLFVLGGRGSESERDIQLGGAYVVEPSKMPASAHYVALGHLHRPQKVGGTVVPCRYSGSPLCYSFSEADQQKEVVIIDIEPGGETLVNPVKLSSGKPMRHLRFANFMEAYNWCENVENHNLWVDMEIQSPEPLDGSMVSELRKLHSGVINIRVILPGVNFAEEDKQRISELSLEEKFYRFVAREIGAVPEKDLVELFLELAEGSDVVEADQT